MKNRTRNLILAVVGIQFIVIIGLLALPMVAQAIPGRYRVALQERSPFLGSISEEVIAQVAPVATALPAPELDDTSSHVDLSALAAAKPTATPMVMPTETAVPTQQPITPADDITPEPTLPPTATPSPTTAPTPVPLPVSKILPDMKVVKQSFNNCGPANLTQVLNWWGNPVTQEEVASYLKPNSEDRNVSAWQIADYVNEQTPGYNAIARSGGSLEMVKKFIAAGYPVVIEKGYELPESGWWGHYITIYGYDDTKQELYSQDSYLGPWDNSGRIDSYDEIEKYWQQFNYTFYVVYTPDKADEVASILGEEMFDDLKMWQYVASLAESETQANPDDAMAWFNMGTAFTRIAGLTGDQTYYQGGAQAYDKAREIGLPPRMLWYQFQPYLAYWKVGRYQDVLDLANATLDTQGGRNVEETYWYMGHVL
ncbi:MAG: C39 family peptidase, partial [Chloroflexi bacterium]|nr:C39 family peptidase [Chloroflexota bacterium]